LDTNSLINEIKVLFTQLYSEIEEPISPNQFELNKIIEQFENTLSSHFPYMRKNYIFIRRIDGTITYENNLSEYVNIPSPLNVNTYLSLIKPEYLFDFLCWTISAYKYAKIIKNQLEPLILIYRIRIPIQLKDGNYYWVLQESSPLQFDKNKNMLSHLNSYTITERYVEKSFVGITGEVYYKNQYNEKFTAELTELMLNKKAFVLSPIQIEIIRYFYTNPKSTITRCAINLKYPLNTIKKYISNSQQKTGIIDKAKLSFPDQNIKSLKDIVSLLSRIGWFY